MEGDSNVTLALQTSCVRGEDSTRWWIMERVGFGVDLWQVCYGLVNGYSVDELKWDKNGVHTMSRFTEEKFGWVI